MMSLVAGKNSRVDFCLRCCWNVGESHRH